MPVVAHTGTRVAPGELLFSSVATAITSSDAACMDDTVEGADVVPGEGCVVQYVERPEHHSAGTDTTTASAVQRCVVATRPGVAQWDGRLVSVFPSASRTQTTTTPTTAGEAAGMSAGSSKAVAMGPRPVDTVHVRVTRLTRLFAFGEIVAVNWHWCSHRSMSSFGSTAGVFKGVLRVEDIRPFKPTKDQLQPPAPSLAFGLGDVVLAEVISQSDAHQYQLSTVGEGCGVVESHVCATEEQYGGQEKVKLQHIPGRRDAMMVPGSGAVVARWCPLLP